MMYEEVIRLMKESNAEYDIKQDTPILPTINTHSQTINQNTIHETQEKATRKTERHCFLVASTLPTLPHHQSKHMTRKKWAKGNTYRGLTPFLHSLSTVNP